LATGVNPFIEANVMREARSSIPEHLKEPINNCRHEEMPANEVNKMVTGTGLELDKNNSTSD